MTDAESRTTYTEYDELGRVEAVREGSATAVPAKEFTYDSLPGALGQPVASIRHTGRLQRTVADRETSGPHRISDGSYAYDKSGTITSHARQLTDVSGSSWDTQCFTYDVMGELLNAWTSNITPTGAGNGCKASNGAAWGPRTDYTASSGPVADAPDASTDVSSPDTSLASTRAATAPDTATVSTGGTAYHQSFTFDWLGNRAAMTEHDPADATKNVSFKYGYGTPQPHTMKWISSDPAGRGSSYTYDAVGNTEVRDLPTTTQNLTWTHENKLDTITDDGKKTTYVYDTAGNRVLENSPSGSTLYLGDTEVTADAAGAVVRASRTYGQAGAPSVTRTTSNGATTGHQLSVLLTDHLGTANTAVFLSSGQAVTRRAFKPYGETRGAKPSVWPNKRGYLGVGIDDAATGLTHIGAREYDQDSGRFLSADPVIDIADPLQMNGYAYSNNSPVSKSDPSGLKLTCGSGFDVPCPKSDQNGDGVPEGSSSGGGGDDNTGSVGTTKAAAADYRCGFPGCSSVGYSEYGKSVDEHINNSIPYHSPVPSPPGIWEALKFAVFPDNDEWKACGKNPGINSHCGWAATDLPWVKVLKALKFLKVKKADDVVDSDTCTRCSTSAADGERLRRQLAEEAGQLPGIRSADDIFDTPSVLRGGVTPDQVRPFFAGRKAWVEEGLGKGRNSGGGWVIREYTERGDPTGRMLRWNPGGGHHGKGAYWRVVGPEGDLGGIIR